jgi:hypothetical protein
MVTASFCSVAAGGVLRLSPFEPGCQLAPQTMMRKLHVDRRALADLIPIRRVGSVGRGLKRALSAVRSGSAVTAIEIAHYFWGGALVDFGPIRSDPTVSHDAGLYVPLYISGLSSCGQESRPRPTRLAGGLLIHVVVAGKGNHCLDAFPSD